VRAIREQFPSDSILTEEGGGDARDTADRWIVDPLDGTTNYLHGYPMFCVSIAYVSEGRPQAGAIYAPVHDELFSASRGSGASLNGRPLVVSTRSELRESLLCAGFSAATFPRYGNTMGLLYRYAQAVRHDGSAALNLAYVAAARFEAYWETGIKPWDIAAGTLIVQEAGGKVTGLHGGTSAIDLFGGEILASNGAIHLPLAALLRDESTNAQSEHGRSSR
jgi:myo-inositol-1(or 4)-monophosphatase